jgi:hypothetical protein
MSSLHGERSALEPPKRNFVWKPSWLQGVTDISSHLQVPVGSVSSITMTALGISQMPSYEVRASFPAVSWWSHLRGWVDLVSGVGWLFGSSDSPQFLFKPSLPHNKTHSGSLLVLKFNTCSEFLRSGNTKKCNVRSKEITPIRIYKFCQI